MKETTQQETQSLDGRILAVLKELVEHHSSSRCVAEQMGQAHNYVARILRGETKLRLDVLERILETLGVSQSFFLQLVSSSGHPRDLIEVLAFYGADGPAPEPFIVEIDQRVENLLEGPAFESQAFAAPLPGVGPARAVTRHRDRLVELEDRRQTDRSSAKADLEALSCEILGTVGVEGLDRDAAADLAEALSIWATIQRFEGCRRDTSLAYRVAIKLALAVDSSRALGITLQKAAYLLRDLDCSQAALVFLDHASRHFLRDGDMASCAKIFVDRGSMFMTMAEYPDAVREFSSALHLLPVEEWRNRAGSFGNLAICYEQLGRFPEAKHCLEMSEAMYGDRPELGLAYVRWNRGSLAMADGEPAHAEGYFTKALQQLEAFGQPLDFATLALSLAEAYMRQGKVQALRDLADRMLAWLPAIRGNRIADAALMEWIRCARWGEVTHQVLREARQKLQQAAGR